MSDRACSRVRWLSIAALAALPLLPPLARGAEEEASLEPSAEETALLELINRARADPSADGARNVKLAKEHGWDTGVDFDMYLEEISRLPPAPPLVIDVKLMRAARNHSTYCRHQDESAHAEIPGAKFFTGKKVRDRARAVGFQGRWFAENVAMGQTSPTDIHVAFSIDGVDDGEEGPGNMKAGRWHRVNLHEERANVCGLGLVRDKDGYWTTQAFSHRPGKRFAGGVAYVDKNASGFYDVGEGVGDVEIRVVGGGTTRTWASGAYTLTLLGDGPVRLEGSHGASRWRKTIEGKGNVKFDVVLLDADLLQRVDDLLSRIEASKPRGEKQLVLRKERLELHILTNGRPLDDSRADRVAALTADVSRQLSEDRAVVPALLDERTYPTAHSTAQRLLRAYRGTAVEAFFRDGVAYTTTMKRWGSIADRGQELSKASRRKARSALEALRARLSTEAWSRRLDARIARLP